MNLQKILTAVTILFLLIGFGFTDVASAEPTPGYPTGDDIEDSVEEGDTDASIANLIAWWKANSGIEMGSHEARNGECKKVVGFRFDFASSWDPVGEYIPEGYETEDAQIFYCAVDIHREKITLDSRPDPDSVIDLFWSFQATVFFECDTSKLALTPSPASIEVGEDSTVDIQVDCEEVGGVGGKTVNLWLSEGSPGDLDNHEVTTDDSGHASVNFHADGDGTATVNAQILICLQDGETQTIDAECRIEVGSRKLQVDLIYIGETHQQIEFMSSFVHRMEIDLQTSDSGVVTGSGTGKTSFDFEYHNEEVHTEDWSSEGFTDCTAAGTFVDEIYTINIDTTGAISYTHVVDVPGGEPIRIPIESDIDWDQLLAEPIVIGAADDATFSASGSFPWGLTYFINAKWVSDAEGE